MKPNVKNNYRKSNELKVKQFDLFGVNAQSTGLNKNEMNDALNRSEASLMLLLTPGLFLLGQMKALNGAINLNE